MLTDNSKLRDQAWLSLKGKWANAIILYVICMVVASALSLILSFAPKVSALIIILVMTPIGWALEVAYLEYRREHMVTPSFLFSGFQQYERIFVTKFLQVLYTNLWSLLLVVPGIMKAYSYAMTSFILHDEPLLSHNAAIEKSMAMMEGHKMKLFLLDLSFIGWIFLSFLSMGIGLLWLVPYMYSARAGFYEDLKKELNMKEE